MLEGVIAEVGGDERRALPHDKVAEARAHARGLLQQGQCVVAAAGHRPERHEERCEGNPDGGYEEEEHDLGVARRGPFGLVCRGRRAFL